MTSNILGVASEARSRTLGPFSPSFRNTVTSIVLLAFYTWHKLLSSHFSATATSQIFRDPLHQPPPPPPHFSPIFLAGLNFNSVTFNLNMFISYCFIKLDILVRGKVFCGSGSRYESTGVRLKILKVKKVAKL